MSRISFDYRLQNFLLPGFLATFRAAKMASATHMHCKEDWPEFRHVFMTAFLAFIVAGDLLDTETKEHRGKE